MYNYPYGDNQQINLNWIISEIIALHQRLDPDYTAPTFTQIYPFSETQQLNLDWILTELKALKELAPTPPPTEEIDEVGQALIAGAYDADTSYQKNDYIVQDGKVYRANAATTGTFDPTKWNEVMLGNDLAIITRWADATNTFLNSLAASNVANDSSVTGTTVKDALNTLKNAAPAMTTDNVTNESGVTGATATAALNNLNGAINAITPLDTTPTSGSTKGITSGAVDSAITRVSEKHEITLSNKVTTNITAFAVNGIGYINFGFNNQSVPTTAYWTTMATLESDYRPSAERYFNTLIIMDGVSEVHVGRITTSGNIDINHLSGEHTISSIRATIPYVI